MSGNTGVRQVNSDNSITMTKVIDLQKGDMVQGMDANLNFVNTCTVIHVVEWGEGALYGNYTSDHYMLDQSTNSVLEHGEVGPWTLEKKYTVLTTCPMAMDESGQFFSPLDGAVAEGNVNSWELHFAMYKIQYVFSMALDAEGLVVSPETVYVENFPPPSVTTAVSCAQSQQNCMEARDIFQSSIPTLFKEPASGIISAALGFPWPEDPASLQTIMLNLLS
jgi:hypothetical protein